MMVLVYIFLFLGSNTAKVSISWHSFRPAVPSGKTRQFYSNYSLHRPSLSHPLVAPTPETRVSVGTSQHQMSFKKKTAKNKICSCEMSPPSQSSIIH